MPKTKQTSKPSRKQLFLGALDFAGMTQEQWADQAGISYQHLYLVLKGERKSPPLCEKIDAFVAEQLAAASAA